MVDGHVIVSCSPEETCRIAASLAQNLTRRAILALHGDLGSGKTCFARGIATVLGITQPITSPTFTIVNEYAGSSPFYHIDLYRLNNADEVLALGFEEYLEKNGITVIEWAERAGDLLPPGSIHIYFTTMPEPNRRTIRIVC